MRNGRARALKPRAHRADPAGMNVNAALSAVSSADFRSTASMAVARMALDQARTQGDAVNALIRGVERADSSTTRSPAKDPSGRLGNLVDVRA